MKQAKTRQTKDKRAFNCVGDIKLRGTNVTLLNALDIPINTYHFLSL
jgi:hypothetical protein